MTSAYSIHEASRIVDLTVAQIEAFVKAELVQPARDERGPLFSFQDLTILRSAKALLRADVPRRRVAAALAAVRARLPESRPLSKLRVESLGQEVVVADDRGAFDAVSGQAVFEFEPRAHDCVVSKLTRPSGSASSVSPASSAHGTCEGCEASLGCEGCEACATCEACEISEGEFGAGPSTELDMAADDWFDLGLELEASSVEQARDAYRRALELDPAHDDARLHLGCLLRSLGRTASAAEHFRVGLLMDGSSAEAAYCLGDALESLGDDDGAIAAFRAAIANDPLCGDAYLRLSRLHERRGEPQAALEVLKEYRRVSRS